MSPLAQSLTLIGLALLPNAWQAAPPDAAQVDVLPVTPDRAQRMTVPVRLGENGPYRFLIDTGAQNTVVSDVLAERLALPRGGTATVVGVAGRQRVGTVELDEVALGSRSFYGIVAPVLDSTFIGADGIIGLDGLQGQRVLLDFRRNVMAIDDAKALGGDRGYDIVVTARRRSGQLIMADARIDGVRVNVVVDTGSDVSIGNRALQQALARRTKLGEVTLTSVTGQTIRADSGTGHKLELGGLIFTNTELAFTDSPAFAAMDLDKRPALLLGMTQLRLFKRVAIDFSTRKVLFDAEW